MGKIKLITYEELYKIVYKEAVRDYPFKYFPHKEWLKFVRRINHFWDKLNSHKETNE